MQIFKFLWHRGLRPRTIYEAGPLKCPPNRNCGGAAASYVSPCDNKHFDFLSNFTILPWWSSSQISNFQKINERKKSAIISKYFAKYNDVQEIDMHSNCMYLYLITINNCNEKVSFPENASFFRPKSVQIDAFNRE